MGWFRKYLAGAVRKSTSKVIEVKYYSLALHRKVHAYFNHTV